jgi:PAS domain S-box-containing protein
MADTLSGSALSDREREVLALAGEGKTDKEIAQYLAIAPKTVRTYWDRMRQKMDASSRTQVLAKALKQTYDALRESEQTYRQLLDLCEEGVWMVDESGATVLASGKMAAMLGFDAQELLELGPLEVLDEGAKEALQRFIAEDQADGNASITVEASRKDGKKAQFVIQMTPRYTPEGVRSGTLLVVSDLTGPFALRAAVEQRLWALMESVSNPIARFNREHACTYANAAFCDFAGFEGEEFLGKPMQALPAPLSHPTVQTKARAVLESQVQQELEIDSQRMVFLPEVEAEGPQGLLVILRSVGA